MASLRKLNDRNQITLPPDVLRDAGVAHGSLMLVEAHDGKIVLEPRRLADADLSEEDWDALDRSLKRQTKARRYAEYASPREARAHLRRRRRA